MMTSNPRRALDRWARDYGGCADFDTYIRAGGGVMAARDDIRQRIDRLTDALRALQAYPNVPREPTRAARADSPSASENPHPSATIGPEALARAEADQHGEQPLELGDPDNAHVQGADAAPPGDDHV